MNNTTLQIKLKERLNKLASNDYDNLECWQIMEAVNKAQLQWVRRTVKHDEESTSKLDDLQKLLTSYELDMQQKDKYYESRFFPSDYLGFKRVSAKAESDCCPARDMYVYLTGETDIDLLLGDELSKPSFDWAETFCTLFNNKVRIYTNGEFTLSGKPKLIYIRAPRKVAFSGCKDTETGTTISQDVELEFKEDIIELILDEAAAILAGDIENFNQVQRNSQSSSINS